MGVSEELLFILVEFNCSSGAMSDLDGICRERGLGQFIGDQAKTHVRVIEDATQPLVVFEMHNAKEVVVIQRQSSTQGQHERFQAQLGADIEVLQKFIVGVDGALIRVRNVVEVFAQIQVRFRAAFQGNEVATGQRGILVDA